MIDHFRNQDVTTSEKFEFAFGLNYPLTYLFKKELASKYQETGMFMSAYELLIDVELNEEAVKCLAISGRNTDAIKTATDVIAKLEKA